MLQTVFEALFGCVHRRTTFPRAHAPTPEGTKPGTYVMCLDCGCEIPYDWGRMKFGPKAGPAAGRKGRPRREPDREPARRVPRALEATCAKTPPDAGAQTQPEPQAVPKAIPEAYGGALVALAAVVVEAQADSAAGVPPVACRPGPGSRPANDGVRPALPPPDNLDGAGGPGGRPARPMAQPSAPSMARPRTALPATPAFRPYLFAKSPAELAMASNGAHSAAENDVRGYLDRAGLRFRKVQVALRVLTALMAGAPAQPDDVALLVAWAGPENRGYSAEQLARQVVEWAGSS